MSPRNLDVPLNLDVPPNLGQGHHDAGRLPWGHVGRGHHGWDGELMRPTITDVAEAAGVSKGTVSRVLNGSPRVSPQSRAAVHKAIETTGFKSNAHARSLAKGAGHAIAAVVATPGRQVFQDPTFASLIDGVIEGMRDSDRSMVILLGGTPAEDRRTLSYLSAGHVDGILHLNPSVDDEITKGLADSSIPMVLCGQRPHDALPATLAMVACDDFGGVASATEHLLRLGKRRVAFIGGPANAAATPARLAGYRDTLGARFEAELVAQGDYSAPSGHQAAQRLLHTVPDLDGLVCASDRMAAGALEAIRAAGKSVPDDVAVIGFDDHPITTTTTPQLSTVRQPIEEVGRLGVTTLLQLIEGHPIEDQLLPTELVLRQSA